jgi:hypothetical protein
MAVAPGAARAASGVLPDAAGAPTPGGDPVVDVTPFDRQGMWIWYVDSSHEGDPARIIGRARVSSVGTVYIKAGDGSDPWRQFTAALVARLQRGGLNVCAWQFVYGEHPVAEAKVGAAAVAKGADCLVIDAEGHYEGRYASADRYIRALRARIGRGFPLSLCGFPYVDYHPAFPYSVLLGPGGASYSQPQMYWKAIGTSVRSVFEHTYFWNRAYKRPLYPLGQTYQDPGVKPLRRFKRYARTYGQPAVSWWSWQETSGREWGALSTEQGAIPGYRLPPGYPVLCRSADRPCGVHSGDLVVWAQQHLIGAGQRFLEATGIYGRNTHRAVIGFQRDRGLTDDGILGPRTWRALLTVDPVRIPWSARVAKASASLRASGGRAAPLSASLPALANEIDPGPRP